MNEIVSCRIEPLPANLPPSHRKELEIRAKINEIIDFLHRHDFVTHIHEDY